MPNTIHGYLSPDNSRGVNMSIFYFKNFVQPNVKTTETNQNTHHPTNMITVYDQFKEANKLELLDRLQAWHTGYMSKNGVTPSMNANELRWKDGD